MKRPAQILIAVTVFICSATSAQDKLLLETKYYRFYSNPLLNVHLFLYKHAVEIKSVKLPDDSLHFYLEKAGVPDKANSHSTMMAAIKYYRDSLIKKDMLFDSTMRQFSVMVASGKYQHAVGWQVEALKQIGTIAPFFKKQLWPSIDAANKAWMQQVKPDLDRYEQRIITRLQKLYDDTMPAEKIRVDLGIYATWAGAYSYSQGMDHIIISTADNGNQGRLGVEIVFHEGSHFLIDQVYNFVAEYFAAKKAQNNRRQTWHVLLFYTTGNVVKEAYATNGITFVPYYKEAKFEERIPPFKLTTDALALYWDPYMRGETTQTEALKKVIDYILANEK